MKKLTLNLVLPFTVILFLTVSRGICAQIEDAPNSGLDGFPLPYTCPNWGSSMALQFFVVEFIFDLLVYFALVYLIVYLIDRLVYPIKPYKAISITLYVLASIFLCLAVLMYSQDTTFYLHRDFDIKVIRSGLSFWGYYPSC